MSASASPAVLESLEPHEREALLRDLYRRLALADPNAAAAALLAVESARAKQAALNRCLVGSAWRLVDATPAHAPLGVASFAFGATGQLRLLTLTVGGTYLASGVEACAAEHCAELVFRTAHMRVRRPL